MTSPNRPTDEIDEILSRWYAAPPPGEAFIERLKVQLARELTRTAPDSGRTVAASGGSRPWSFITRRHFVAAVSAAAVVLAAAFLLTAWPEERRHHQNARAKAGLRWWVHIDTEPRLVLSPGRTDYLSEISLSFQVAQASDIVRCQMVELKDTHLACEVKRVIYGRVPHPVIHLRLAWDPETSRSVLRRELGREPTEDEIQAKTVSMAGFRPGREVIAFVQPLEQPDDPLAYRYSGMSYDVPPKHPLDKHEADIVETIRRGAHLTPRLAVETVGPYVHSSELIVRARLEEIGDTTAEWRVSGVLYADPAGPLGPPRRPETVAKDTAEASERLNGTTVTVGLDPWRLRAEAVVNYCAAHEPDKPTTEEEIQEKYAGLVKAELSVDREAVLFLRTGANDGPATYSIVAILHDDPEDQERMETIETTIGNLIKEGVHRRDYL